MTLNKIQSLFLSSLLFLPSLSSAEIYQCRGAEGKMRYSDRPCKQQVEQQSIAKIVVAPASAGKTASSNWKEKDEALKVRHKMRQEYEKCLADPMSLVCFGPDQVAVRQKK
ncbi:DUF4124 domain-containing protein [Undibacterium fentianense]|uniref:DUF4124 domain-containing protein n=1 Tax=Undibacterium fentianense TaxID=2828728 RepID=A0A941E3N8_9BURK|nr:DUF4124 domain-containing protein [Undibacterium fentianense]MBR7801760.1 DUF4124 domain-containing protein [Undibacterium fentianense]